MKEYRATCPYHEDPDETYECAKCHALYIGPDCGHVPQPTPVVTCEFCAILFCDQCYPEHSQQNHHRKEG